MILPIPSAMPVLDTRPNIILFIVDDLGPQDNSAQLTDQKNPFANIYQTPNLKRLAAKSTIYTSAYSASPVCTPTRTSIMTGKHPARTKITYWTFQGDTSAADPKTKPPRWQYEGLLPDNAPFLPKLLAASGYQTIHVGKAHFGAIGKFAADPKAIGFQVNIAGHAAGSPGSFYGTHNFAQSVRSGNPQTPSNWDTPGLEKYHGQDIFLTEALAIEASSAITTATKTGRPFFMNFAPYAVHTPIMPNKRYVEKYRHLDNREAAYASMVETYDAALGALLTTLEKTGQSKNTIIIFTSDNGGLSLHSRDGKDDRNAPFRAGKGSFYEGGTRIPLVIHTPNQKSSISPARVISYDLFSIILNAAKLKTPQNSESRLPDPNSNRPLIWHTPHYWGSPGQGVEPNSVILKGDYKLIYKHRSQSYEMYNITTDVGEIRNLIDTKQDKLTELRTAMRKELIRTKAQMPTVKATGQPVPLP